MTAEFACGQILFNVKKSNLHYHIEETHKSTYITIRKKFIDRVVEASIDRDNSEATKRNDEKIRLENGLLKQDISDLKTKCANIEVVKEEIEMKNESLSEIIKCLEEKLDDAYGESRMLKDTLKRKADDMNENLDMKENKIIDLEEELLKLQISYDILGAAQKESEENTMMLENVVESKIIEISDLKKSLKIIKKDTNDEDDCQPSTSKCGKCEYESDGENDLLMHIKSNHDITCDVCALTFQSEAKLKTHV